jgi:hypothetical protein
MSLSAPRRLLAALVCAMAWFGVIAQFVLTMQHPLHPEHALARRVSDFFSYFTILTNLLVALTLSVILHAEDFPLGRRLREPRLFTGIAVAIVLVGGAYELLLRAIWKPQGFQFFVDLLLHDLVPLGTVFVWGLLIPKGRLGFRDLSWWLLYPGLYLVYTLARGALLGAYPYPFLDVTAIGYGRVLANAAGILVALLGIGAVFVAVDRRAAVSARVPGTG